MPWQLIYTRRHLGGPLIEGEMRSRDLLATSLEEARAEAQPIWTDVIAQARQEWERYNDRRREAGREIDWTPIFGVHAPDVHLRDPQGLRVELFEQKSYQEMAAAMRRAVEAAGLKGR